MAPGRFRFTKQQTEVFKNVNEVILQVKCCVPLHPLGGAEHKTTSFPASLAPFLFINLQFVSTS
jgi:hypothetical protein